MVPRHKKSIGNYLIRAIRFYVYFPRRKAGTSPKFFSYLQGPCEVMGKCSNMTHEVNCVTRGTGHTYRSHSAFDQL